MTTQELRQAIEKAAEFDDNEFGPYVHHRFATMLRSMISRGEAADIAIDILKQRHVDIFPFIKLLTDVACVAADYRCPYCVLDNHGGYDRCLDYRLCKPFDALKKEMGK